MATWSACYRGLKVAYHRVKESYLELAMVRNGFLFTLFVGFLSGFFGNFIDIDHVLMFYGGPERVLHKALFVVAVCVALYCGARIGRLFVRMVLENRHNKKKGRRHESLR